MRVEFGTLKGVKVAKVWDKNGTTVRFDGDELEWLTRQLASGKDGEYEPAEPKDEPKKEPKPAAKKKASKKKGLFK